MIVYSARATDLVTVSTLYRIRKDFGFVTCSKQKNVSNFFQVIIHFFPDSYRFVDLVFTLKHSKRMSTFSLSGKVLFMVTYIC